MKHFFKSLILTFFLLLPLTQSHSDEVEKKVRHVGYFNQIFGHIHQNPNRYSTSLTNIACGYPIRVYEITQNGESRSLFNNKWRYISAGPYEGYVLKNFISHEKPECFQDKYPRFFEAFELSITEMHFWGRLYDHFLIEKTEMQ